MTNKYYNILPTKNVGFCGKDSCLYDVNYDRYTSRILSITERNNKPISQEELNKKFEKGCTIGLSIWEIFKLIQNNEDVRNYFNFKRIFENYKNNIQ